MHGNVAETDGLSQPLRERRLQQLQCCQSVEGVPHRLRGGPIAFREDVGGDIHAKLRGPGEIDRDDVLEIGIEREPVSRVRGLFLDPCDAAAQGLQLFLDQPLIHCFRLASRIRRR